MHGLEFARRRALKREDRLLLIADREDRAPDAARPGAGEELARDPPYDFPLLRAGVLRFIDQDMVDAGVELVIHPGGAILGEQHEGLVDQVVIVEQPTSVLGYLIAGEDSVGDGDQRGGTVAAGERLAAFRQRQDARAFGTEALGELRIAVLDSAGD